MSFGRSSPLLEFSPCTAGRYGAIPSRFSSHSFTPSVSLASLLTTHFAARLGQLEPCSSLVASAASRSSGSTRYLCIARYRSSWLDWHAFGRPLFPGQSLTSNRGSRAPLLANILQTDRHVRSAHIRFAPQTRYNVFIAGQTGTDVRMRRVTIASTGERELSDSAVRNLSARSQ